MLTAILELIPVGLATAVSTVPLLASISILLSPNRVILAWPFLVGFCSGMLLMTALFAVGLTLAPTTPYTSPAGLVAAEGIAGVLLLGVAVAVFARRHRPARPSTIAAQLQRLRPGSAVWFGLLLNLRPKALVLSATAGVIIGGVSRAFTGGLTLIVLSVAIGASSVALPIIFTQARPTIMEPRLRASQAWIVERQSVVTAVALVAVGLFLIVNAALRLST